MLTPCPPENDQVVLKLSDLLLCGVQAYDSDRWHVVSKVDSAQAAKSMVAEEHHLSETALLFKVIWQIEAAFDDCLLLQDSM